MPKPHLAQVAGDALMGTPNFALSSRHTVAVAAGQLEVRDGDATELPWPDGRFTAVVMNQVVFWLPDPERVPAETHRVLAPGGELALLTASRRLLTQLVVLPYLLGGMRLYHDAELTAIVR